MNWIGRFIQFPEKHNSYYLLKLNDEDYEELCAEAMGIESSSGKHSGEQNRYSIRGNIELGDYTTIEEFLQVIREIRTGTSTVDPSFHDRKKCTVEGMILGDFIEEERWDYWLAKHKEESK